MNKYKSKKTGVVIMSESELGGDWEVISENSEAKKKASKKDKE